MGNKEEAKKHFDTGMNFCWRVRFDFAIQLFTEAIKLASDSTELYCNRGIAYV